MKKWEVINSLKPSALKSNKEIIEILLANRGIKTKKEIDFFLNPKLSDLTIESVGIDKKQVEKTIKRIEKAIKANEKIIVFGDYDVDGITGTAILWETLYTLKANVMPYIPNRVEEGYGLSVLGIENLIKDNKIGLIITVDNGIVAMDAVEFANKNNIDVIITDHHTLPVGENTKLPNAFSIVHTTNLCGAGVAYLLANSIEQRAKSKEHRVANAKQSDSTLYALGSMQSSLRYLDLVTLATIADLVPLTNANRAFVKIGLPLLRRTKRIGLLELFKEAEIDPAKIGVYEIGHIIAPRLNAMGRLESAMDSLRLLCTKDKKRAEILAQTLGKTNRERQLLTKASSLHAIEQIKNKKSKKILILSENYEEGIIGLVAGRLVENFYHPAIVISKKEKISKGSARSVGGFNIIEFIRKSSHLLINAGGHPMAAGFTVEAEKILELQEFLENLAIEEVKDEMLIRTLKIDLEILLTSITQELFEKIKLLSPFGMGCFEPTFLSKNVCVLEIKAIGKEKKHLKLKFTNIEAIAFGFGELINTIKQNDTVDIVYTIDENEWNNKKTLQLKIKDIKARS